MVLQMDIDRVRYLVASYLRIRLAKVGHLGLNPFP